MQIIKSQDYIDSKINIFKRQIPSETNCTLCSCYLNTEKYRKYISDTILFETDNFFVVPQYHNIVPGYILLASKRHVKSIAYLNTTEFEELKLIIDKINNIFKKIFNFNPLVYEHGSEYTNCKGTVHLHIHILPITYKNSNEIINKCLLVNINCYDDIKILGKDKDYLFFQDNNNNKYFTETNDFTINTLRACIATSLGNSKIYSKPLENYETNIKTTIKILKNKF